MQALGIADGTTQLTPAELMSAILKAPVDLLWNGGIGTYVKSEGETNADVGDRANNALRVNGRELRAKVVGEGGNLGFTQRGRIEAAQHGVLLNTDFIDNSAGVDTSDHEVNIKILLNDAVQRGELSFDQRNTQLAAMTDEVERLVLSDNYRQNQAITVMEHMSAQRLGSNAHFIRTLEEEGLLDRQIEFLPSESELAERKARHQGLTRPELSVLLSYSKIKLFQQLLDSDVPEDPYLSQELVRYFPEPLRKTYAANMQRHRLKREIIATVVTNSMVNRMDATFVLRMQEDTGQSPAAIAKAYSAVREIVASRDIWAQIEALDGKVAEEVQVDALLKVWDLQRTSRAGCSTSAAASSTSPASSSATRPASRNSRRRCRACSRRAAAPTTTSTSRNGRAWARPNNSPGTRAHRRARRGVRHRRSRARQRPEGRTRRFGVLRTRPRSRHRRPAPPGRSVAGREPLARAGSRRAARRSRAQHALVQQILAAAPAGEQHPVARWLERDDAALKFTLGMLNEIRAQPVDYPIASVALRRFAQLVQAGAKG
jgi:glutamate dehydrogenase